MKDTVIEFKNALDKINWSSMPFGFKSFPLGVCGDISDILAEHLYRSGYENITYVCGKNENGTHAWLEIDGKVIDVTADQFDDVNEKVLIQAPELWHANYEELNRRKAGYKDLNGPDFSALITVHNEIIKQINCITRPLNLDQQEAIAVAHVMITCPETGEAVWTGNDFDKQSWETASISKEILLCPACLNSHAWDKDDALLSDDSPP